jgi:hypothetical protein
MQGKVGDTSAPPPPTELKTLGIQGLKKQLEGGEAEKLTANGDDEEKRKEEEEEEKEEGPVIVEEEYQDVVMAGPQGGLFSKYVIADVLCVKKIFCNWESAIF